MTVLSKNRKLKIKGDYVPITLKVVDGAVHIYEGGLVQYEQGNIGYVQEAADTNGPCPTFAGIALEEVNVSAADNTADGTYSILVLPKGCGAYVELPVTTTITIANQESIVYVDDDGYVDLASGISNFTGGSVGTIKEFVDGNTAWVKMDRY